MNEIELYNNTKSSNLSNYVLTEQQESVVDLFVMGLSVATIAKISKISISKLGTWIRGDKHFIAAVTAGKEVKDKLIADKMGQAGLLAANYAIDLLSQTVDSNDIEGRRLQASIAKTILTANTNKGITVAPTMISQPVMHIEDKSKEIIDRYRNGDSSYVVIDSVQVDGDEVILFPGTAFGVINSEDGKFQCHICGQKHYDLVVHLRKNHDMSPVRYRKLYHLNPDVIFYPSEPMIIEDEGIDNV